jgi:hypothetical protein
MYVHHVLAVRPGSTPANADAATRFNVAVATVFARSAVFKVLPVCVERILGHAAVHRVRSQDVADGRRAAGPSLELVRQQRNDRRIVRRQRSGAPGIGPADQGIEGRPVEILLQPRPQLGERDPGDCGVLLPVEAARCRQRGGGKQRSVRHPDAATEEWLRGIVVHRGRGRTGGRRCNLILVQFRGVGFQFLRVGAHEPRE